MVTIHPENTKLWYSAGLEYMRYQYKMEPGALVVDIGAYRGEWSDKMTEIFQCRALLFEPTDNIFYARHGDKINACAWVEKCRVRTNGAFYYTSQIHDGEIGLTSYDAVDIAEYFPSHEDVEVLKMNIEGAEYELLQYMIQKNMLARVKNFQVQFHITDKFNYQYLYDQIAFRLKETHELEWRSPFVWENWKLKNA